MELIDLFRIPHFEFSFLSSDFPIPPSRRGVGVCPYGPEAEFQFLSSVI